MAEQQKEESQKTVVSFVVGLLIGGLLVWAFSGKGGDTPKPADTTNETKTETSSTANSDTKTNPTSAPVETIKPTTVPVATLPVGNAKVSVGSDVAAGKVVPLDSATFPTKEGWVGVRDYSDGKLGGLLGVARFSAEQGLVPKEIDLLRATVAGKQYAIVFYSENGDRKFDLATDVQNGNEFATFTAK
jgi:hypothetical protein